MQRSRTMAQSRDIIVIGGSAGAIEGLLRVVGALPASLAARIFVAVHIPTAATSALPKVLERAGPLRATHPNDGDTTRAAMI